MTLAPAPIHESAPVDQIEAEIVSPYVEVQLHGTGAGTVIEIDGEVLVLTAAHVVEGYSSETKKPYTDENGKPADETTQNIDIPTIRKKAGNDEMKGEAPVVWYSAPEESGGDDLALLKPKSPAGLKAARLLLTDNLRWGETTYYIGTPAGMHSRLERSIVSLRHARLLDRTWTATNGCGWYGNSGGGLYVERDGHYVLAGVVTRKEVSNNPQNMIYAKLPTDIEKFLASYRKHKKGS